MSKKVIRKDKTCLNCRHVVENKFCPNCGQENSDTRKTFHHLFIHFFEDLTHYENAFWRTIKNLLFKPSVLTKEYLSGKRLSYLAPVRLYIFISFLTFFLLSVLPAKSIKEGMLKNTDNKSASEKLKIVGDSITKIINEGKQENIKDSLRENGLNIAFDSVNNKTKYEYKNADYAPKISKEEIEINALLNSNKISDSTKIKLKEVLEIAKKSEKVDNADFNFGYDNIQALDSAKAKGEVNATTYWFMKKAIKVKENNTKDEIISKGFDSIKGNFPKVLIIYMPLFAFFLWLFHGKKRWYYFDHGIFTLHYFSFLLLISLIIITFSKILDYSNINNYTEIPSKIISILGIGWMFYYFFPAHHRFYAETRKMSFLKSIILFFINMFFILIILILFFLYTLINIK